jgi:hypothetical protein
MFKDANRHEMDREAAPKVISRQRCGPGSRTEGNLANKGITNTN